MQQIDLFSGVGGFSVAAHALGVHTKVFCEIQPFQRAVLAKNFPNIPIHGDIRTLTYEKLIEYGWNPNEDTILTGGFPCQPFSVAGKRKGTDDDRYLWPEMLRVIQEAKPRWVVGENVGGFASMEIDTGIAEMADQEGALVLFKKVAQQVVDDLNQAGYDVPRTDQGEPVLFIIPACAINAPHRRDRVWIIASRMDASNSIENGYGGGSLQFNSYEEQLLPKRKKKRCDVGSQATGCGESAENTNSPTDGELQEPRSFGELGNIGSGSYERHTEGAAEWYDSDSNQNGMEGREGASNVDDEGANSDKYPMRLHQFDYWRNFPVEPPIHAGDDGLRSELVRLGCKKPDRVIQYQREEGIKSAGNAIVPWVYYEILKAILD